MRSVETHEATATMGTGAIWQAVPVQEPRLPDGWCWHVWSDEGSLVDETHGHEVCSYDMAAYEWRLPGSDVYVAHPLEYGHEQLRDTLEIHALRWYLFEKLRQMARQHLTPNDRLVVIVTPSGPCRIFAFNTGGREVGELASACFRVPQVEKWVRERTGRDDFAGVRTYDACVDSRYAVTAECDSDSFEAHDIRGRRTTHRRR